MGEVREAAAIGAEPAQERVFELGLGVEHLDIGSRVEQGLAIASLDSEAQLPPCLWQLAALHHIPAPVELVVAVDRQPALEAGEHPLAAGGDLVYLLAGQYLLIGFEVFEGEEHVFRGLPLDGGPHAVGRSSDLRALGPYGVYQIGLV